MRTLFTDLISLALLAGMFVGIFIVTWELCEEIGIIAVPALLATTLAVGYLLEVINKGD